MPWLDLVAYCFGGAFLSNAIPHLVRGVTGQSFQTPFARPRGSGQSSSTVNVLWGFCNIVVSYLLVYQVGSFDARNTADAGAFGLGLLAMSLGSACIFGRYHGGNRPEQP